MRSIIDEHEPPKRPFPWVAVISAIILVLLAGWVGYIVWGTMEFLNAFGSLRSEQ